MSATPYDDLTLRLEALLAKTLGADISKPGWRVELERARREVRPLEFADPDGEPLRLIKGGAS